MKPQPYDCEQSHFVYLYRDKDGSPLYVGYGESPKRAISHINSTHSVQLEKKLVRGGYSLEIAGPFESPEVALAVETALISAMRTTCNIAGGQNRWRFRPLGVPLSRAERPQDEELTFATLKKDASKANLFPILFVRINEEYFDSDGRFGYDPSKPPRDKDILARIDRWWQLARRLDDWITNPTSSPGLLVGIYGPPGAQIVIGSVFIARESWSTAETCEGLIHVPTRGPADLDALELRGRRISREVGLRFGPFRQQVFILLKADGTREGGASSRPVRIGWMGDKSSDAQRLGPSVARSAASQVSHITFHELHRAFNRGSPTSLSG
jgi:hypothetical protein